MRLLLVAGLAAAACSAPHRSDTATPATDRQVVLQAPRLDAIRPDSVVMAAGAVVEVVLEGSGFAPGRPGHNTIIFDAMTMNDVPADDAGTHIRLVIPETIPSGGEAPPQPVTDGPHIVRVRTASGESNPATVRVFK